MLLYLLNAERILPIYTRSLCMVAQQIGQFSLGRAKQACTRTSVRLVKNKKLLFNPDNAV